MAGDFTGDGDLDLAVANLVDGTVSVLLGNGDGTFGPAVTYAVGSDPCAIVAGDFTGDGSLDLAVANGGDATVSVLLGNGDGTFQNQVTYAVGLPTYWAASDPSAIVAGDFTGDGHLDLAVANNSADGTVSVLMGNGDGTFQPQVMYAVGSGPDAIVAGDFTGNGRLDLAVADGGAAQPWGAGSGGVSVLLGNGDGTFGPQVSYAVGSDPEYIAAGDFTGDGRLDLAVTDGAGIQILLGNGDGTFQPPVTYSESGAIVAGDFTGDGETDLAVASGGSNGTVSVLQGNGGGIFGSTGESATALHATPLVADVTGDGTDDVLVVDGSGNILYRQGIPGQPGTFQPPITINPGFPSRDIVWVPSTDEGPLLASVDAQDNAVSLYAWRNGGFVRLTASPATGQLPAQIIAADLNGTGMTDLVVRNAGDGTLSVYFGTTPIPGRFSGPVDPEFAPPDFPPPVTLRIGLGATDVEAVDTTGDGRLDLVVTNEVTGQVSVLLNLGNGTFAAPVPYRAGTGSSAVDPGGPPQVTSLEETAGVAAGPLTPGGPTSFVTINPGSNTLDVLAGLGGGRFANPVTIDTSSPAQVVRMADFTGNGVDDLAVLTSEGLCIYLGNGQGGFLPPTTYAVPPQADGLTVADLIGNGNLDLLVGDAYGDVLVLMGNGDGTFQPYREANQDILLAVADLGGNGTEDVVYADQGLDQVVCDYGVGQWTVLADRTTGLLDPGAVTLADLSGNGIPDLIVANSGGNNVLIYPGLGNGQFGPAVNDGNGYFVGTDPVGITVAYLTGPVPDLVIADEGSNQVSILLNHSHGSDFSFTLGPRLNTGGLGPVSTVVGNFTGGAYPDLLVTNSGSGDVMLLPGVGQGNFNDQDPRVYSVGTDPVASFVGNFDGNTDLVTVNAGSNDLTMISGFEGGSPIVTTIASDGEDPTTAFAFDAGGGFEDLVVGNGGDGVFALFAGSSDGLSLASTTAEPDLPSPTAMVFAGLSGGAVQFYAATDGREAAALVALSLGGEIAPVNTLFPSPTVAVAQLVPLQESSLALAGTLLIVTIESPSGAVETDAEALSVSSAVALTAGQSVPFQGLGGDGDEPAAQRDGPPAGVPSPPTGPSWQRLILGTDEARERFDRQHPELFPAGGDGERETGPTGGQIPNPAATQPVMPPGQGISPWAERRLEAIDRAIELRDGMDEVALERSGEGERWVAVPSRWSNAGPEWTAERTIPHRSLRPGAAGVPAQAGPNSAEAPTMQDIERRLQLSASLALAASAVGAIGLRAAGERARSRTFPTALRRWPAPSRGVRDTRTDDD